MFELLNEDLEDCIEILRQMSSCESKNEQLRILAENRTSLKEIQKTIDLCELMCYYDERVKQRKDL
jgi:hypothetical protein